MHILVDLIFLLLRFIDENSMVQDAVESETGPFVYILDDETDASNQNIEIRESGERRVSFPSPDKLAVYQEPEDDHFNLCK